MLLDPLEEQLDLLTALVEPRDRERRQGEVVGQKYQPSFVLGIVERDAAEFRGIQPRRLGARQDNRLIAAESRRLVDLATSAAGVIEILLAPRDKERGRHREAIEPLEIDVAAIHDVARARFDRQVIEDVHIVHFPVGNVNKARDRSPQIEQRMELDGALPATILGPRKQAQTQVNRRRIERVDGLCQLDAQRFLGVQPSRAVDQHLGEVGIDSPAVGPIGIGQRTARDLAAKPGVIQLWPHGPQTRLDVPQAFAEHQLRESQTQELVAAGKTTPPSIASVLRDARGELASRQKVHELRKQQLPVEHKPSSAASAGKIRCRQGPSLLASPSRVHALLNATRCNRNGLRIPLPC